MEAVCVARRGQTGAIKGRHGTGASVVLTPRSLRALTGPEPQLSPLCLTPSWLERESARVQAAAQSILVGKKGGPLGWLTEEEISSEQTSCG